MVDYLFYRISKIISRRRFYYTILFLFVPFLIAFMPMILSLTTLFFGCYENVKYALVFNVCFIFFAILYTTLIFRHYSPRRIRRIYAKYGNSSKFVGNIKLFILFVMLCAIFLYGNSFLGLFIQIPEC